MVDKCWLNKANNMKLCQKLVLYISNIILESQVIILMGKSDTGTSGGRQWRHLLKKSEKKCQRQQEMVEMQILISQLKLI